MNDELRIKKGSIKNGSIFGVIIPSLDVLVSCPGHKIKDVATFHHAIFLQNYYFIKN